MTFTNTLRDTIHHQIETHGDQYTLDDTDSPFGAETFVVVNLDNPGGPEAPAHVAPSRINGRVIVEVVNMEGRDLTSVWHANAEARTAQADPSLVFLTTREYNTAVREAATIELSAAGITLDPDTPTEVLLRVLLTTVTC